MPWEDDECCKTAMDYLIEIGIDIAEHNAQLCMHSRDISYVTGCLRLQVLESLKELNAWWEQWEADHGHLAKEVPVDCSRNVPFSTYLTYEEPWIAFTVCVYGAMRILLLQVLDAVRFGSGWTSAGDNVPNSTCLLGITSNVHDLAHEIMRSLSYSYERSPRFIFTCSFLFLQEVVYSCFDEQSEEAQWLMRHGWAEAANRHSPEDANLLRGLLPSGQMWWRKPTRVGAKEITDRAYLSL